jgi:hypothetical protein
MGMGIGPGTGAGIRGGLPEEKNVAQLVQEHTNVYARKFQGLLDRSTPHVIERWIVTGVLFLLFLLNVVLRQGVSGLQSIDRSYPITHPRAIQMRPTCASWRSLCVRGYLANPHQWYIVCYALAIYILNLFLAFLQPRFDPSLAEDLAAEDVEEGAPGLPGSSTPKSGGGIKGLLSGFSNGNDEEEFRPFIRRLPGGSTYLRFHWDISSCHLVPPSVLRLAPDAGAWLQLIVSDLTGLLLVHVVANPRRVQVLVLGH